MHLEQEEMSTIRPSMVFAEEYRPNGWWPDAGVCADLRRWRDTTPDAVAIDAFGAFMIGIAEVEGQLMHHHAVAGVAVVGYPGEHSGELASALITALSDSTPTLDELRKYLTEVDMTGWYLPTRIERLDELPRNSTGNARIKLMRCWLDGSARLESPS
jgi:acyl-CoA synthetase (AMP-forming)/AMP-acid ligase II